MIPLFIDMSGMNVVVFGAGTVGRRKANYFVREAKVTAIGLDLVDGFDQEVDLVRADIDAVMADWIEWADLVIAATDNRELNDRIAGEASQQGRLCNRADGMSDFLIPSVVEKDTFTVAISTEGRSPAMSRHLRLKLDRELDGRYDSMVRLQEQLRAEARSKMPSQEEREAFLRDVLDDERIWSLLPNDQQGAMALAMAMMEEFNERHF